MLGHETFGFLLPINDVVEADVYRIPGWDTNPVWEDGTEITSVIDINGVERKLSDETSHALVTVIMEEPPALGYSGAPDKENFLLSTDHIKSTTFQKSRLSDGTPLVTFCIMAIGRADCDRLSTLVSDIKSRATGRQRIKHPPPSETDVIH